MRQRRCERGALTLASAEVKFEIDSETHDPLDIGIKFCKAYWCYISEFAPVKYLVTSNPQEFIKSVRQIK